LIDGLKSFAGKAVHVRLTPLPELKTKQPDPLIEGWTLGWVVFRAEPWDFRGLNGTDDFVPFE